MADRLHLEIEKLQYLMMIQVYNEDKRFIDESVSEFF